MRTTFLLIILNLWAFSLTDTIAFFLKAQINKRKGTKWKWHLERNYSTRQNQQEVTRHANKHLERSFG
jgi:hypothetical protein